MKATREKDITVRYYDSGLRIFSCKPDKLVETIHESIQKCESFRFASFKGLDLRGVNFSGVNLQQAEFIECNLGGVSFERADLECVYFDRVNLRSANFKGADLNHALFKKAFLEGACFEGSNLIDTSFYCLDNPKIFHLSQNECEYRLTIVGDIVTVGCQQHHKDDWRKMTKWQIFEMDGSRALKFYPSLLDLIDEHTGIGSRPYWINQKQKVIK